jgi:hypothetical protein
MISSTISRAKVAEWTARAEEAPEGFSKRRMQQVARNWAGLVAAADAEDLEALGTRGRR